MLFLNLPIEIWYLIIQYINLDIDKFCLKKSYIFFNNLINEPKYFKFNSSLINTLVKNDRLEQYLWILNKYNLSVKYIDYSNSLILYKCIYLNEKITNYDTYVKFIFEESNYENFSFNLLFTKNSKFGKYLFHKGVFK